MRFGIVGSLLKNRCNSLHHCFFFKIQLSPLYYCRTLPCTCFKSESQLRRLELFMQFFRLLRALVLQLQVKMLFARVCNILRFAWLDIIFVLIILATISSLDLVDHTLRWALVLLIGSSEPCRKKMVRRIHVCSNPVWGPYCGLQDLYPRSRFS